MNTKPSILVFVYSALVIACSLLARFVSPETAQVSFVAGLVGGIACALLGALERVGRRTRGLTMLVLFLVSFTLLAQTVLVWASVGAGSDRRTWAGLLITLMLLLSVGLLAYLAYTAQFPSPSSAAALSNQKPATDGFNKDSRSSGAQAPAPSGNNGPRRSLDRTT